MTREEAVARIKDHIEIHRYNERNAVKIFEALDMAIKALEQPEPCEDAVSREEVIASVRQDCFAVFTADERVCEIRDLPPVTPKQRTGKWIPVDSYSAFGGDEATWMAHGNPVAFYYCSECKEHAYAGEDGNDILSRFCPNCGARMER